MKYRVEKVMEHSEVFYVEADSMEDAENKIDDMEGLICNESWLDTNVDEVSDEEWDEQQSIIG